MNNRFELTFLDAIVNFSKNTIKGKKIIVNIVTIILHRRYIKETLKDETQLKNFNSNLRKIMITKYISDSDKKK